jgi:anti-anti-sigma factor
MEANSAGQAGGQSASGLLGGEEPRSASGAAFATVVVRPVRGLAIVAPRGTIDDANAPHFMEAVVGCLDDGAPALVIDLSMVSSVNAAGLAVALYAGRRLGAQRVAIVCPDAHIVRILRSCGFERLLMICESREMAVPLCLALEARSRLARS